MKRSRSNNEQTNEAKTARLLSESNASLSGDQKIAVIQVPSGDEGGSADTEVITIVEDEADSSVVLDNAEYIEEITDLAEAEPVELSIAASGAGMGGAVHMINVSALGDADRPVYTATTVSTTSSAAKNEQTGGFTIAMGNTVQSQKAVRSAAMKSSNLLSLMASVAAQSAIASARRQTQAGNTKKSENRSEPVVNEAWHEQLRAIPFSEIQEEEVISWINVDSIQKPAMRSDTSNAHHGGEEPPPPQWMLNPCRRMCVFVQFTVDARGQRTPQYLCNFCRLTESTYSGILQHLNHHLFVCGLCPFYSATRFDVELHRQRVGHMQPLAEGYIVHKQGTSVCVRGQRNQKTTAAHGNSAKAKADKTDRTVSETASDFSSESLEVVSELTSESLSESVSASMSTSVSSSKRLDVGPLLEWLPIQEETESLIIMDGDGTGPPASAKRAFYRRNPLASASEISAMSTSSSVVCALPYYRYVAGKSNRRHVLEFHCNFCQSTPTFTQELYRHIDFHALDCPHDACTYRCFTRLELHLHERREHAQEAGRFLDDLVVLVPLVAIPEQALVENATMCGHDTRARWSVVLELPNIAAVPGSAGGGYCRMRNTARESEYRCTICNLFIINKGGMSSHLKMHNIGSKDIDRYMEPI